MNVYSVHCSCSTISIKVIESDFNLLFLMTVQPVFQKVSHHLDQKPNKTLKNTNTNTHTTFKKEPKQRAQL